MSLPFAESCEAIANFSWLFGAVCGLIVDLAIIVAIAHAPRLRDNRDSPAPVGFVERWLLKLMAFMAAFSWFAGLVLLEPGSLVCYARYSASAAGVVIGLALAALIPKAASDIARRSAP